AVFFRQSIVDLVEIRAAFLSFLFTLVVVRLPLGRIKVSGQHEERTKDALVDVALRGAVDIEGEFQSQFRAILESLDIVELPNRVLGRLLRFGTINPAAVVPFLADVCPAPGVLRALELQLAVRRLPRLEACVSRVRIDATQYIEQTYCADGDQHQG